MPTYFYWGEDEYQITQAVRKLRETVLDSLWVDFNYHKIVSPQDLQIIDGINLALTSPFGYGDRLVWLSEVGIGQHCSESLLKELEHVLPLIPSTSHLLFTSSSKLDARLRSTKLLQKYATILEFSQIPSWKTDHLVLLVRQLAGDVGLELAPDGIDFLVDAVGNDTHRLAAELEKLQLWLGESSQPLSAAAIAPLVNKTAHNSIQLAGALRQGNTSEALSSIAELLANNEVGLRIAATLTGQFRTWLWVKVMLEAGERDDKAIAQAAELGNPKRLYFLKQEVQGLSSRKLVAAMTVLLRLDVTLKRGGDETAALQTAAIEICEIVRGTAGAARRK